MVRRPTVRAGMTLIDLVVTTLVIGILAAVAVPGFSTALLRHRALAAARRIQSDLRAVRRQAIVTSSSRSIQFDSQKGVYTVPGQSDLDHPNRTYTVRLAEYPYQVKLAQVSFGAPAAVSFNRYGQPNGGGSVTIQAGSEQRTVTVDPDTGHVSIQ